MVLFARAALRLVVIDARPLLIYRDFRLLWTARLVTGIGSQITYVALWYQIYQITRSPLAVGLVGLVQVVPILLLALIGGSLADLLDRRRVVLFTEAALAAVSILLLANAGFAAPQVWILYVAAALGAGLETVQRPSLDALIPRLVDPADLVPAAAISSLQQTVGVVAAPALGGILIATVGLPVTYGVDVATFLISLGLIWFMRAVPAARVEAASLSHLTAGLRYALSRRDLLGTYLVDMAAMIFGMPEALFPALAVHLGGARSLGFLFSAPAAGALLAAGTSGWTRRVSRQGTAIAVAASVWGLAMVGLGFSPSLLPALACLALAGGADEISALFRSAVWNRTIPDDVRGRVAGVELISYASGPALGNLESGVVASLFSVRVSIISGGVLCVAGVAAVLAALPAILSIRLPTARPPE
ncbi:MAG TPA: MFS transporter [Chloroflexota bacterium]|nr:MFS transporter [Chloroflexota bacterium]